MKIFVINTYYEEFLAELYRNQPGLAQLPYAEQWAAVQLARFSVSDAYSVGLHLAGAQTCEVICNAEFLQDRWAAEHGASIDGDKAERRRRIVALQIQAFEPDVVLVLEWCPLGDAFLQSIRAKNRLIAGQIGSPLPANRTFIAYDLMLSCWPPIVDFFRRSGKAARMLRLAFDERIAKEALGLKTSGDLTGSQRLPVTFVGGFAANHAERIRWLESLATVIPISVFGYGADQLAPESPIRSVHHGPVWGLAMYDVLRRSEVTLNHHATIDVRGVVDRTIAANMRLYEATGVGACLVTEAKANLSSMFEPDDEVVTWSNDADCIAKVQWLLRDSAARTAIARRGRLRTLRDHTYAIRMRELFAMFEEALQNLRARRSSAAAS